MVDGIILGTHMLDPEEYKNLMLPIVALDMHIADHIPSIHSNHIRGGQLAADELIRNKCRCVLNVIAVLTDKSPAFERHRIVSRELKKNGIRCIDYTWNPHADLADYYEQVNRLFDRYPEADAVFSEDFIVMNAIKCANERGLRMPDDFKAVGYDGTLLAKVSYPSMTYVAQPIRELAEKLVATLIQKINGKKVCGDIILDNVSLVHGNTTLPV